MTHKHAPCGFCCTTALLVALGLGGAVGAQCETAKLFPADDQLGTGYGWAVDLDGPLALVGAFLADDLGLNTGAVHALVQGDDGDWSEACRLLAPDGEANDFFGYSVAISGTRAVIGAPTQTGFVGSGAAEVFEYDADARCWVHVQQLLPVEDLPAANVQSFGVSVALDGNLIAVGNPGNDEAALNAGAVYLYAYDEDDLQWHQQTKLLASTAAPNDGLGLAVDIDGTTIVAGAPNTFSSGNGGSVHVFDCDDAGLVWSETAAFAGPAGTRFFGADVAIDDDTMAVYTSSDDLHLVALHVYELTDGVWQPAPELPVNEAASGFSSTDGEVDIDGSRILASLDELDDSTGAVVIFELQDGEWTSRPLLQAADAGPGSRFGARVAICGDTALTCALGDEEGGEDAGAVYVIDLEAACPGDLDGDGIVGVTDLQILLEHWGACEGDCPPHCVGDLDEDCDVGVSDLLELLRHWSVR